MKESMRDKFFLDDRSAKNYIWQISQILRIVIREINHRYYKIGLSCRSMDGEWWNASIKAHSLNSSLFKTLKIVARLQIIFPRSNALCEVNTSSQQCIGLYYARSQCRTSSSLIYSHSIEGKVLYKIRFASSIDGETSALRRKWKCSMDKLLKDM